MGTKRSKIPSPPPRESAETSASDLGILTRAFQDGLIVAWKRDLERGYRLTLRGRPDEFVEVAKLARYLEGLRGAA